MSFAPDSTSWRTRCAPRKPVPPVIKVVAGTFLTMAACFFVLFLGTIWAVRFFEVVLGISKTLSADYAKEIRSSVPGAVATSFLGLSGHEFFIARFYSRAAAPPV